MLSDCIQISLIFRILVKFFYYSELLIHAYLMKAIILEKLN